MKITAKEFLVLNIGTLITSFGVYFLTFPNNLSMGGVTGIAVIMSELIPMVTPATMAVILNLVLLVLGFIFLNRSFGFKTIYCTLMFSLQVQALEWLFPMSGPLTDQKFLEVMCAVFLSALGAAILFNLDASTGGTDILAMIIKKYSKLEISRALIVVNFFVAVTAFFIFDLETGIYSLAGMLVRSFIIDTVIENLNMRKALTIITSRPDEICHYIIHDLHRSATVWDATGLYSHANLKVILTGLSRVQAVSLRQFVRAQDPHAFIMTNSTSEIFGKGFSNM